MTQRRIYQDEFPYFVTTNTRDRRPFFDDIRYARLLHKVIIKSCWIKNCLVYAFCVMPDHLHLLVGKDPTQPQRVALGSDRGFDIPIDPMRPHPPACCRRRRAGRVTLGLRNGVDAPNAGRCARVDAKFDISQVMHAIKSYYYLAMRTQHGINYPIWQPRFNTRIVDTEERLRNTIEYIKNNPIKAGLPKKYQKLPYMYFNWELIYQLF